MGFFSIEGKNKAWWHFFKVKYTLKDRSNGGLKNRASEKTKWCRYFWHRSVFFNDDVDTVAADDVEEMGHAALVSS